MLAGNTGLVVFTAAGGGANVALLPPQIYL